MMKTTHQDPWAQQAWQQQSAWQKPVVVKSDPWQQSGWQDPASAWQPASSGWQPSVWPQPSQGWQQKVKPLIDNKKKNKKPEKQAIID